MTSTPDQIAAARARIAARVARDRFAAPETMRALQFIAAHFDAATTAYESYDGTTSAPFTEAEHALADARELITLHREGRFPVSVIDYITAPLAAAPLPTPRALNPVSEQLAAQEKTLRAELDQLHADTAAANSDAEDWFGAVLAILAKWMRLAGAVDVDNARPCNRRPAEAPDSTVYDTESSASRQHYTDTGRYLTWDEAAEGHVRCPKCGSSKVRFGVREWATCQCGHGDLWSAFMACDCWGYDCPAIQRPAQG